MVSAVQLSQFRGLVYRIAESQTAAICFSCVVCSHSLETSEFSSMANRVVRLLAVCRG